MFFSIQAHLRLTTSKGAHGREGSNMVTYTWFTDEMWETSVLWSFSQSNLFLILAISVFGGCDLSDSHSKVSQSWF